MNRSISATGQAQMYSVDTHIDKNHSDIQTFKLGPFVSPQKLLAGKLYY